MDVVAHILVATSTGRQLWRDSGNHKQERLPCSRSTGRLGPSPKEPLLLLHSHVWYIDAQASLLVIPHDITKDIPILSLFGSPQLDHECYLTDCSWLK